MWFIIIPLLCLCTTYIDWPRVVDFFQAKTISTGPLTELLTQRTKLLAERDALSPQDQYAKWTKANRKLDKLDEEISKVKSTLQTGSSQLKSKLKTWVSGGYYLLKIFAGNSPVGYPIPGMFPNALEKLVLKSDGGLGLFMWTNMISTVFGVFLKGIVALMALALPPKQENKQQATL